MELFRFNSDFEAVKQILDGKKNETIEGFIKRMNEFDNKFKKIQKILNET
jgi:hypothetical protein